MKPMIEELLNLAHHQAEMVILTLKQDLMPTWLLISRSNKIFIVGTPWRDDEEKALAQQAMRKKMRESHITAYSFITEAWTAQAPPDWDPKTLLPEDQRPMNRSDRREVVVAMASDGQETGWRVWEIKRDWNEQVRELEEITFENSLMEGWMKDMLK
jgi:hypothetical protein